MSLVTAANALVQGQLRGATTVEPDGSARPWRAGDPSPAHALLIPGLVNAHLHLELTWAANQIPTGLGFDHWLQAFLALEKPDDPGIDRGIEQLIDAGTEAVSDICNGPDTAPALAAAGLRGIVQRELFGLHAPRQESLLARAAEPPHQVGDVVNRASPHALYSTPLPLLRATIDADGLSRPSSIHLAESLDEIEFLTHGEGPFPARFDAIGLDWRWWEPPLSAPVTWLAERQLLHDLLVVHAVHLTPPERHLLASSTCTVVLCPRSNLHIGGELPDVPALIEAGVSLALGTDSLASSPDLDVLQEVRVLTEAFPDVPLATWLHAATHTEALGLQGHTWLSVHPERPWEAREVVHG